MTGFHLFTLVCLDVFLGRGYVSMLRMQAGSSFWRLDMGSVRKGEAKTISIFQSNLNLLFKEIISTLWPNKKNKKS